MKKLCADASRMRWCSLIRRIKQRETRPEY
jgi:hypothetical protein